MKRLSYLLVGMLAVLFLSGGCYVTFYPCMTDQDQTEVVVPYMADSWQDSRIIEQAMTAVIWNGNMTHCSFSFINQLAIDVDGDTIPDPQGTQTYSVLNIGWYADSGDIFPSAWNNCWTRGSLSSMYPNCCQVWTSIFHPCNHFGHPTQFNGNWNTTGNPTCDHGGVYGNWVRTSIGYRPGECRAGIVWQHYGLDMPKVVSLMEKGTRVDLGGDDALAFNFSADNTEIVLSQEGVSQPIDLGDYEGTFYLLLDSMTIRMIMDADDTAALPAFQSYSDFLGSSSPGSFLATITYEGITGTYPYAGQDTDGQLLQSINAQIDHLRGIRAGLDGSPIDGSTRDGRLF